MRLEVKNHVICVKDVLLIKLFNLQCSEHNSKHLEKSSSE